MSQRLSIDGGKKSVGESEGLFFLLWQLGEERWLRLNNAAIKS